MTLQLLLTETEAAERLRLCARTLRNARKAGELHYVLIGRAVRYTVPDLESFIERQRKVDPACPATPPTRKTSLPRRKGGQIVPFRERNERL